MTCAEVRDDAIGPWSLLPLELQAALTRHVANCPHCEEHFCRTFRGPQRVLALWKECLERIRSGSDG